jgi:hypothetical protein
VPAQHLWLQRPAGGGTRRAPAASRRKAPGRAAPSRRLGRTRGLVVSRRCRRSWSSVGKSAALFGPGVISFPLDS